MATSFLERAYREVLYSSLLEYSLELIADFLSTVSQTSRTAADKQFSGEFVQLRAVLLLQLAQLLWSLYLHINLS